MSRYLVILLALNIQGFASIANANDLDKWNSEQGRVVRSELKSKLTTTYTEKPNPLHTDSTYKASENGGKILTRLETKAEIKGSRVGATIEAFKTVDKAAVASKWAKEFAKGGVRFAAGAVLVEMAVREMVNGVGWIIDEGGKVVKVTNVDPNALFLFKDVSGSTWRTFDSHVQFYKNSTAKLTDQSLENIRTQVASNFGGSFQIEFKCISGSSFCSANTISNLNVYVKSSGVSPVVKEPLIPEQIEQKINDYLNDPSKPQNVKDALIEQAVKPKGKASIMWSDDPSSEQTIFSDHKNTAEKILNSDNPQGDGLTKTTPVITDGTATETETNTDTTTNTNVNETTTTNPDGSTTTTGSNTSTGSSTTTTTSKLPAFCDYASKLCDWLDWTKEMPEDEEKPEEENINDRGIFNRELDTQFNLEGSCPSDFNFQMTNKYFAGSYTIPLNWLCISFTFIGYALIFLSNCIGMWILYETVTRKELRF